MITYWLIILSILADCQGIFLGTKVENITECPYMGVTFVKDAENSNKIYRCAVTILDKYNLLTACICLKGMGEAVTRIGSTFAAMGGVEYTSKDLLCHPDYDENTFANNIALILIKGGMDLDGISTEPVKLAEKNTSVPGRAQFKAYGWGGTSAVVFFRLPSPELAYANVTVVESSACQRFLAVYNTTPINDEQFCAGAGPVAKPCPGDNGGPAMLNGEQVGMFSNIPGTLILNSCGDTIAPVIYTKITEYYDWIQSNKFQP